MNSANVRPIKCCKLGTYECQIPMPIKRRIEYIDYCVADIVAALNAANLVTGPVVAGTERWGLSR